MMGIFKRSADLIYTFRFIKLLTTPFDKTPAYELGLIDEEGKRNKNVKLDTAEKKDAYTPFHRLVYNIKKIINKAPGSGKLASYAAALYLIKEKYGISPEKILETTDISKQDLLKEQSDWFILEDNMLAPGVYKIKNEKLLNSTLDERVKPNDQIRIVENTYPVGDVFGIHIYEGIHISTNQPIYLTVGELLK